MKKIVLAVGVLAVLFSVRAEEDLFKHAKLEILVEEAAELQKEAYRKGSEFNTPQYKYFIGLVYGCGTNLLARKSSAATQNLQRKYVALIEKNYAAYEKVETATAMADAAGPVRGRNASRNNMRNRAKRLINARKMGEAELQSAIKQWENLAREIKR